MPMINGITHMILFSPCRRRDEESIAWETQFISGITEKILERT